MKVYLAIYGKTSILMIQKQYPLNVQIIECLRLNTHLKNILIF